MNKKIRVVQIIAGFSVGDLGGGSELFGIRMAESLDRERFEVALCCLWSYDTPVERRWHRMVADQGIPIFYGAPFRDRIRVDTASAFAGLYRHLWRWRADIINTHNEFADIVGVALRMAQAAPLLVRTGHTELEWTFQPRLGRIMHAMYPFVCAQEMAVSRAIAAQLDQRRLARLSGTKAQYAPNGVDAEVVQAQRTGKDMRTSFGIGANVPLFGTVARISPQKGLPYLVQAMAHVRSALPNAQLLIVGKGEKTDELRAQIVELGLENCITLLGARTDVMDIVDALDVFVLPSLWEGLPTVVLEAMLLATPVVATDVPGTRDLILDGQTGLLVPARDPDALAKAMIQQYVEQQRAAEMTQEAIQHAEQFAMRHTVKRYETLYHQLYERYR
jgi:glycosyltransferase involved in cell wall biosynthesis